jgi:ABC-2 type transport system ATP-binding protein
MPAPSSTPAEALRAEGVVRALGGVRALDGVSFVSAAGSLVGLVGANGSGKTTLLRLFAGVASVDAGRVSVLGLDPLRDASRLRPRVGYAEQHPSLDPEMTGGETLRLFAALRGLSSSDRAVSAAVDTFGLAPFVGRLVSGWSGGERQRLHLALALLHAPSVLLLDEPTAGIDAEGRRRFWGLMSERRAAGGTILVSTHDLGDVERYCDRVLVLHRGALVADDAPVALVRDHGRARATITLPRERAERADALVPELRALPGGPEVEVEGGTVTLWRREGVDGPEPALALLDARGVGYVRYERAEADLASACVRLTGVEAGDVRREGRGGGRGRGRRG